MKSKFAVGRKEAEVDQKLEDKLEMVTIQISSITRIDKGTLSSVTALLRSNGEMLSFFGSNWMRSSKQIVLSFLYTQPTRTFSWHDLGNHGGSQLVKLLGIVLLDGSGMRAHWKFLTSFVFPDPSNPASLLAKYGFTHTFLLPTNAAKINCSGMLIQIQTVSVQDSGLEGTRANYSMTQNTLKIK